MFSSKPVALLVLKRDALVAYDTKGGHEQLGLTTNLVRNLEVIDGQALSDTLVEFAASQGLRKRSVLLLLDESVIFQKTYTGLGAESDPTKMQQDYIELLPFDPADRSLLVLQPKGGLVLIGTNGQFYTYVVDALQRIGTKVTAVVPVSVYGKLGSHLTAEQVRQIVHNHRLATRANFLDSQLMEA